MSDLETIEQNAVDHLTVEEGRVEAGIDAAGGAGEPAPDVGVEEELPPPPGRLSIAVAFPTIGAAVMAGGVFTGIGARFYAVIAGVLGVAVAYAASKLRRPLLMYAVIVGGLFGIGMLMVVPSGIGNLASVASLASAAANSGDVLRPPVPLTAGWQAILGWLLGSVGFVAGWLALVGRRAPLATLVPLPIAAIAGISVPNNQQVGSGIAVLVLFAIGLGVLSTASAASEEAERPPLGYEVRRALRALPLLVVITVALYALAQTDLLFPKPYIDPTQEPQRPRTAPLSEVEDRVLFEVESSARGPWRVGSLDVYDGESWRLPPFAENKLEDVPRNGIVDADLRPGVRAAFKIAGLGGAVLPGLPNPVGIVAEGPRLAFDERNGNIRLSQGQVQAGLEYSVVAAALPSVEDLRAQTRPIPGEIEQFLEIPDAPPAVQSLIDRAPQTSKWDTFDFLRTWVLENVTSKGPGQPQDVTPERVQDMIAGSKEGSPFEIVAAQAMLARWAGIPSRIGYGFDGGDQVGPTTLQVRPRNGSTFPEVFFPGYKWLPVIGTPKKAQPSVGNEAGQQQDPTILPSNEVAVQLYVPVATPPKSVFAKQLQRALLIGVPIVLVLLLGYFTFPVIRKAVIRSRRRTAAQAAGPRSRIALAYADWRDTATDFGYRHTTDTPLMFLDRFPDDPEHIEFAWLVTRALWGDLQHDLTPDLAAAAEELSASLRRRLAQAHPGTVRAVARMSRLSLRDPFAPELNEWLKGGVHAAA